MTVTVLRNTGQGFCSMPLNFDLSDVFSLKLWDLGRKTKRGKMPTHHMVPKVQAINITDYPDQLAEALLSGSFTVRLCVPTQCSWEASHFAQPTVNERGVKLYLLEGRICA